MKTSDIESQRPPSGGEEFTMTSSDSDTNKDPNFMPDANDPKRVWADLGGDLEASYDGARYVDIRVKGSEKTRLFISKGALERAIGLFVPDPVAP